MRSSVSEKLEAANEGEMERKKKRLLVLYRSAIAKQILSREGSKEVSQLQSA